MSENITFNDKGRPLCPRCEALKIARPMAHSGTGNSGSIAYKAYKCTRKGCGYYWLNHAEPDGDFAAKMQNTPDKTQCV